MMPNLSARRLLRLAALVVLSAAGQQEGPYFALSSGRTFASGAKATVGLSAWNVDALEFRVYRVQSPNDFFRQLEEPHQFGGRVRRPARERTALERIHEWKHGLRTGIRRSLREQFTESPSAHIESLFPKSSRPAEKGTRYAETPLLNSQQLVLTFHHPVQSQSRWGEQTVDVGVKEKGVYLVEAVNGNLRAYTILMVTDLVLITKAGQGRLVNLVLDRASGQPMAGVPVELSTRDQALSNATTNADGIAELPVSADVKKMGDLRVLARHDRDYAINTFSSGGPDSEDWLGYVYTDRPVYRPGHTVHFKALLRLRTVGGMQVPAGHPVAVEIQDPDQKPVYQKTLTANANGTLRDDLVLGAGAALGHYFVQVKSGEGYMNGSFEVEEYKKPEYEVRVTPAKPRLLEGDTVQATIDARYYFGEPVNGAKVTWAVYRERYWYPRWYDRDDDDASDHNADEEDSGDQLSEQEGKLDAEGKLAISFPTAVSEHKNDFRYRIEARVTDAANREITGRGWVVATYASFLINLSTDRYFYTPGATVGYTVQARTYENHPVAARAQVQLVRWTWRDDKEVVLSTTAVDTGTGGSAQGSVTAPAGGGSYRLRVTAHTPEGREVLSETWLWISGGSSWDYDSSSHSIEIVTDKKTYRAGDTARLLIVAGKPNTPVYVTVEGRDLRQYKLIRSTEATVSYELPVTAADEPNLTVSAAYVRDGVLYNGVKNVRVPPVEHQLAVNLSTDKPQYQPGQAATYNVAVTGADGKPVPRAELSLGVVDEAIYAVRRDATPDIVSVFFGREWNRVFTGNSLEYYFHGEAGTRRMRLAGLRPPSKLAQLKPDRLVMPKIRKAFPDTAFWGPDIVTGPDGRAKARIDFPDSLTTWRATARGITPDTRVGAAMLKTIVRKNLMVRLAVPRFFVRGDEVVVSALVHNYLTNAKTVRVSLEAAGLDLIEGATRDIPVASRGEAKVDWRVRAGQVRTATVTVTALTDEESDAMQFELPVNFPGVKLATSRGGSMTGGGNAAFDLQLPSQVEPQSRALSIRISPSIAGSLFGALEYLTSFPYGCVEQTMSSFLPNIVVTQAIHELGLKPQLEQKVLDEKIRAGLDRLYNFQHEDGGWGWWQTDESHPFMTAYVVAGLVQARTAGVTVQDAAINRGLPWLKKNLAYDPKLAGDLRAYMVYALAVSGQKDGAMETLFSGRQSLSPYGLALLGLTLEQLKDPRASSVADDLVRTVQQDDEQAWWKATRDQMLDFDGDVSPEATAFAVRFLSHQRKDSPLLPKAALWLMNHRNEGYWWASTKQTAMVIYGLTDYLKTTNELNADLTATIEVNGRPLATRRFDHAAGLVDAEFVLDEARLQPSVNRIRVTAAGQGRLYYSARQEFYSSEKRLQDAGTVSLNVLRDYFRLVPGRSGERIVYDTSPLEGPVAPGDVVAVRLTVSGSEWKYLLIEDPIPAGTEFIERDNDYELRARPPWWAWSFTRRELHDDRMAIFQRYFPHGQQQCFYLLKVVNPGLFQASPARVQPMYQPSVMATSDGRKLEVK